MNVLLWMRTAGDVPGGHRSQLDKTAAALRILGVTVGVSHAATADLAGVDVVHGFNLSTQQIRAARRAGAKVVTSTIYWSIDYRQDQRPWRARARMGLVLLAASLRGRYRDKCRAVTAVIDNQVLGYEMADLLLPNSAAEAELVRRELSVTTPMMVVPNAVDETLFTPPPDGAARPVDVLFRGRFEPHKNQLGFIRAMRGTPWRTVVAGPPHPDHPEYYRQCVREATGNVHVEPPVEEQALPELYRQSVVHVLPSWFETTGLVSLEAALCGCRVVTTNRGFARDYFGEDASYCDPARPASIRRAVADAMAAPPPSSALRDRVLGHFTWRQTAAATLAAYERALSADR